MTPIEELHSRIHKLVTTGRMPHSVLFTGAYGYDTMQTALETAALIHCESPDDNGRCNKCIACKKHNKKIHPDLVWSYPVIGTNKVAADYAEEWQKLIANEIWFSMYDWAKKMGSETANPNINADETHKIVEHLYTSAFEVDQKIIAIWGAEKLDNQSNVLLKVIEEPPENIYIFLITSEPHEILRTVKSRCLELKIPPYTNMELAEILEIHEDQKEIIAAAGGEVIRARELLSIGSGEGDLSHWLNLAFRGLSLSLHKFIEEYSSLKPQELQNFYLQCLHFIRRVWNLKATDTNEGGNGNDSQLKMAKFFTYSQLEKITDRLENDLDAVMRYGNRKLIMLDTSLYFYKIMKSGK